jgi:hypothetical protein
VRALVDSYSSHLAATLPKTISYLKRNVISAPFLRLFDAVSGKGNCPPIIINYRENELMYLRHEQDRAVIFFSINFRDSDDVVLSKVFLQVTCNLVLKIL